MPDSLSDNNSKELAKKLMQDSVNKIVRSPESHPDRNLNIKRTGKGFSGVIRLRKHKEPYIYGHGGKIHNKEEIKRQLFNED